MFLEQPLAIVSMACRLPGANSLEEYWELIRTGGNAISELPPERLNQRLYYDETPGVRSKTFSRIGGIVRNGGHIESQLLEKLGLTSHDVNAADKSHLELLGVAIDAIRNALWDPANIPNRRAGVFIGHTRGTGRSGDLVYRSLIGETAHYLRELALFRELAGGDQDRVIESVIRKTRERYPGRDKEGGPNLEAFQAGRIISKALRLNGPYMAINAACASSLYALASAATALQLGEIDMAVVGGASHCKFDSLLLFSKAGSVSANGSRPFDSEADGFVTAEGYVVVIIKTLEKALADGDDISAVIRGIGISSDGRGKSLWAPREEGQVEAIRRAYGDRLDMEKLQYIEAHATSTPVGDATELGALAMGLRGNISKNKRIPVGSVKANIGHTLETAGLAGLVKTVLALKAKQIPPTPNVDCPNPKIDWESVPFVLPKVAEPWPENEQGWPRRAGVNSFGIGGLNAHVVLDEFRADQVGYYSSAEKPLGAQSNQVKRQPKDSKMSEDDIAIVGMGALLPGAMSWQSFWDRTLRGESGISPVAPTRFATDRLTDQVKSLRGGFIHNYQYDWKRHKVPPKQVAGADPLQFLFLDAVDQALVDSGYKDRPFDTTRTGVIVGSIFGGEFGNQLQMGMRLHEFMDDVFSELRTLGADQGLFQELSDRYGDLLFERMPAMLDETGSFTSSTLASRCTKTFNLMGGATAIDSGEASGLAAVHIASLLLRSGHTDMMIVGAGQRSAGYTTFEAMLERDKLSQDGTVKPLFEPGHTVPGEGVGVVILKRLKDAERDGDKIHSVIRSIGVAAASSAEESVLCSVQDAIRKAGLSTSAEIGLLECSADGGSHHETNAWSGLQKALQSDDLSGQVLHPLHVRTVADGTGSLGGATSMASLMRASESVKTGSVAPLLHPPQDMVCFGERPVRFESQVAELPRSEEYGFSDALVTSINGETLAYAAVLSNASKHPRTTAPTVRTYTTEGKVLPSIASKPLTSPSWKVICVGAPTISELLSRLEVVAQSPSKVFAETIAGFHADFRFSLEDRFRLAMVASSPEELSAKIEPASRGLQLDRNLAHLAMQGIFIGTVDSIPKTGLALLMPGQGSQYAKMLGDLTAWVSGAAKSLKSMDSILESLELPLFHDVSDKQSDLLGKDIFRTQLSVLMADALMVDTLADWGVKPDLVVGHSYGEFAAMYAAGVWDFATAAQATRDRCQSIAAAGLSTSAMVSILANRPAVVALLKEVAGDVWPANFNTEEQTVVGGTVEAVERLESILSQRGIKYKRLAVPCAFHTPLMSPAQSPFAACLESLKVRPARIPLLSTVTGDYEVDPLRLKAGLVHQLVAPVPFVDVIRRAIEDGVRLFVEAGPGQVLAGLTKRIGAEYSDVVVLSMDHPSQGCAKSLSNVFALLLVNGLLDQSDKQNVLPKLVPSVAAQTVGSNSPQSQIQTFNVKGCVKKEHAAVGDSSGPEAPRFEQASVQRVVSEEFVPSYQVRSSQSSILTLPSRAKVFSVTSLTRPVRVVEVKGTPREMGRALGEAEPRRIVELLESAAGAFGTATNALPDVSDAMANCQVFWGAEEWQEMIGIAEGCGIAPENIAAWNFLLYPDIDAGCAHFIVPTDRSHGYWHGANEDLPLGLLLRRPLPRCVAIRRPTSGIPHVHFGVMGQVGSIAGMNAAGLSVSSSMLLDRPLNDQSKYGLLHGLLIGRVLRQSESIEDALTVIQGVRRRGAWGITLLESRTERRVYVEYDGAELKTMEVSDPAFVVSNHSRLLSSSKEPPSHSTNRLGRLTEIFPATAARISLQSAQNALRDKHCPERGRPTTYPTMHTLRRVDNQSSIIMAPSLGKAWLAVSEPYSTSLELSPEGGSSEERPEGNTKGKADDRYVEIDLTEFGFPTQSPLSSVARSGSTKQGGRGDVDITAAVQSDGTHGEPPVPQRKSFLIDPEEFMRFATDVDGHSPLGDIDRTCVRFVNRLLPMPLPSDASVMGMGIANTFKHGVLIVGKGAFSKAIESALSSYQVPVRILDLEMTVDQLQEQFNIIADSGLPNHLVLADCINQRGLLDLSFQSYAEIRDRLVIKTFQITQWWHTRLLETKRTADASVVAAISTAGDYGLSGELGTAADGAMCGLIKGVRLETRSQTRDGFVGSVFDFHPKLPLDVSAQHLVREIASRVKDIEVAYDEHGNRYVLKSVHSPLREDAVGHGSLATQPGAWVITGGARGVTAAVAKGLGALVDGTLHLIGSSEIPEIDPRWCDLNEDGLRDLRSSVMRQAVAEKAVPAARWARVEKAIEISRTLRDFQRSGIRCRYWACDVSDREKLSHVLEKIRQLGPPIRGVIHGAGFEKASKFSSKKLELVRQTLAAKVDGCVALMELTKDDPLSFFITFGSISGRFGGIGQVDYCLSNEMATKLTSWYQRQRRGTHVVTLAWHSWDEVGMAVRPETKHAKVMSKMSFMPVKEGLKHLLDEIRSGSSDTEVTITDWRHYKLFTPDPVWPPTLPFPDKSRSEKFECSKSASEIPAPPTDGVARRYVMRMQNCELSYPDRHELKGTAVVLGANVDAIATANELRRTGLNVHLVDSRNSELACKEFQAILAHQTPTHLVLVTGRDDNAWTYSGTLQWDRRVSEGVFLPFVIVQAWIKSAVKKGVVLETLSAMTCLGGDFGLKHRPLAPEGGAVAGLLKSVRVEMGRRQEFPLRVKILDSNPSLSPDSLAKALVAELRSDDPNFEVGIEEASRMVPVATPESIEIQEEKLPTHGEVWVAAGGGRGITSGVALRLAKRFGLKMHLLGRTVPRDLPDAWLDANPEELAKLRREYTSQAIARGEKANEGWSTLMGQIELQRTLRDSKRSGATVSYHVCDVTNRKQLAETLQQIRQLDGEISGVIQGAGVTFPDRIENKKLERVRQMIDVKLTATEWLIELTRQDPLRYFLGFGSISGRLGANGASDYSLGADGMCKLIGALRHQRPEVAAVSFHWHSWGEAGMMTRSTSFGGRSIMKLALMPIDEGVEHILREISCGAPEAEVVITDDQFFGHVGAVNMKSESAVEAKLESHESTPSPCYRLNRVLHGTEDPFLREHLFKNEPLMPMVASIELMLAATREIWPETSNRTLRLSNISVASRLSVPSGEEKTMAIVLRRMLDRMDVVICTDHRTRQGKLVESDRMNISCSVAIFDDVGSEYPPSPREILRWDPVYYKDDSLIRHGMPFRALTHIALSADGLWGRLCSPDPSQLLGERYHRIPETPMAILDACLYASGIAIWLNDPSIFGIPLGVDELVVHRVPTEGEELLVRVQTSDLTKAQASFNFDVWDNKSRLVLKASGYRCAILKSSTP